VKGEDLVTLGALAERPAMSASSDPVIVRDWKWRIVVIASLVTVGGVGIGVLMSGLPPGYYSLGAVALVGVPLGVAASLTYATRHSGIRAVAVSQHGVVFILGNEKISVKWSDLRPPVYPYFLGDISFYFPEELGPKGAVGTDRGHVAVTRPQALAILHYPKCPEWHLPLKVRKSLGL
jgi:hypothetical protein